MESRNTSVESFCGKSQYEGGKFRCGNRNTSVESFVVETALRVWKVLLWKPHWTRAKSGFRAFTFRARAWKVFCGNHNMRVRIVVWRGCGSPPPQTTMCACTLWFTRFSKACKPQAGGTYSELPHFSKACKPQCARAHCGLEGVWFTPPSNRNTNSLECAQAYFFEKLIWV